MTSPLSGLCVLELSGGVAAAFAGRLLRGYGANVCHVEMPGVVGLTNDEATYLQAGKRARSFDDPSLFDDVDIVISDLQPAALHTAGIDWSAVRSARPELIVVSVTPFGLTGPYADFQSTNAVSFAMGGIMSLTGDPGRTPLVTGGSQAYMLAGLNAFAVAVTCWYGRERHGAGELVDLSGQECAAGMLELYSAATSVGGPVIPRLGNHTRAPWAIYPCLDGWAGVFALERQMPNLFALLNDPELDEPRFCDPLQRLLPLNEEALTVKLYVWFLDKTKAELLELSLASKVPIGVATTPQELLHTPGLWQRDAFETTGDLTVPGRPFPGFGWMPPLDEAPSVARPEPIGSTRLPLDGLRVVDLTMMWAGPFATLHLASMGAEVIKVESPSAWDNIRTLVPQPGVADPWNSAYYFNAYNRDKKSLTLDLAQAEGRDLLLRVLADADVLIENYRADVLDKLGLTDEALQAANPRLVTVSMAAFGKAGPDHRYVGFGPVIELMSGLAALTGYESDDEPFKTGISYGDPVAGLFAVSAAVFGLQQRDRTGHGCHVDLAQRETSMVMIGEAFVAASRGDAIVHRGCTDDRFDQDVYRCAGEERWIVVSVRTDAERDAVESVIGGPIEGLQEWLATQRPQDAMERLQAVGVPAGRVLDSGSILDDLQLLHREYWTYLPHPKMPRYRQQGITWRLHDANPQPRRHSPFFGEHNAEILGELGLTDTDLTGLTERRVIADAPINPGVG